MGDPLRVRLFGYGVPYRVEVDEVGDYGCAVGLPDAAGEAERLCRALRQLRGEGYGATEGDWVYSLPFGRCGIQGRPREHIVAHFCAEAYIDVLSMDGVETQPLATGEIADIEPGSVVRFRARPLENIAYSWLSRPRTGRRCWDTPRPLPSTARCPTTGASGW